MRQHAKPSPLDRAVVVIRKFGKDGNEFAPRRGFVALGERLCKAHLRVSIGPWLRIHRPGETGFPLREREQSLGIFVRIVDLRNELERALGHLVRERVGCDACDREQALDACVAHAPSRTRRERSQHRCRFSITDLAQRERNCPDETIEMK